MPCHSPLKAYKAGNQVFFKHPKDTGRNLELIDLPCGQCLGCRVQTSLDWAIRCVNELTLHKQASFLTLTYNDENLPADKSLNKKHLSDFMKRLRKKYSHKNIRFFACGEYGDKYSRPHYHIIVFGHQFDDLQYYKMVKGNKYYTSNQLAKLWKFGFNTIGNVTFQSCAYVTRYVTKKLTGEMKEKYGYTDLETGEYFPVIPEFTQMSLRPGIGKEWFLKNINDVFPSDEIIHEGKRYRVPKYYMKLCEEINPALAEQVKTKRRNYVREQTKNKDLYERHAECIAKEKTAMSKLRTKMRDYERSV